jgi:excisionase family DNA binding protein
MSGIRIELTDEIVEQIAAQAASLVLSRLERGQTSTNTYLTVAEAADVLRAKPQRVYDLLSSRRLTRFRDGARVLVSRSELDAYLSPDNGSQLPLRPVRA